MHFRTLALVGLSFISCGLSAQTSWDIQRIGLYDGFSSPRTYNYAQYLNDAGHVTGYAIIGGNGLVSPRTNWLYDGNSTVQIGLANYDYPVSNVRKLNNAGQVIGNSSQYTLTKYLGQTAWLYNGSSTLQLGLTGNGYASSTSGFYRSFATDLNEAGQVIGTSSRFDLSGNGPYDQGRAAWLYDTGNTLRLGFTSSGYTRNDGFQYSTVRNLNESGQVTGYSERYSGATYMGQTAWLYDGGNTVELGLTGSGYTRTDGFQIHEARFLNNSGQVVGSSYRQDTNFSQAPQTAWLYDGGTTVQLGLTGNGFTDGTGFRYSYAAALNQAGQVAGTSIRYNPVFSPSTPFPILLPANAAWFYDGNSTIEIGLTGSGNWDNYVSYLNEAGQVVGTSQKDNGTNYSHAVWFYDGNSTVQLGLTGGIYTDSTSGAEGSFVDGLNDAGQVVGSSSRFNGSIPNGNTAWFYDSNLDQTFDLTLSERSDGTAYSSVEYLGEDGLVLGTYSLYGSNDDFIGQRAFYFTLGEGLVDITDLLFPFGFELTENGWVLVDERDTAEDGWNSLAEAIRGNALGQIIGNGFLNDGSRQAYLLTPTTVPVPAAAWLFGTAVIGLAGIKRRN